MITQEDYEKCLQIAKGNFSQIPTDKLISSLQEFEKMLTSARTQESLCIEMTAAIVKELIKRGGWP